MRLRVVAGNQGGKAVNRDVYGGDERKTKRGGGGGGRLGRKLGREKGEKKGSEWKSFA